MEAKNHISSRYVTMLHCKLPCECLFRILSVCDGRAGKEDDGRRAPINERDILLHA